MNATAITAAAVMQVIAAVRALRVEERSFFREFPEGFSTTKPNIYISIIIAVKGVTAIPIKVPRTSTAPHKRNIMEWFLEINSRVNISSRVVADNNITIGTDEDGIPCEVTME